MIGMSPLVFVIDDDESVRKGLKRLFARLTIKAKFSNPLPIFYREHLIRDRPA